MSLATGSSNAGRPLPDTGEPLISADRASATACESRSETTPTRPQATRP